MFFLCPHVILKVAQSTSRLDSNKVYENIHMVTRAGFDSCTVDLPNSLLLKCDRGLRASRIKFEQVTFNIFNFNGWSFMPGNTYYFISKSYLKMALKKANILQHTKGFFVWHSSEHKKSE